MELIDITRPLSDLTAVWPGDRQVSSSWTQSRASGDNVNVGAIETSLHAGTHADAPLHFDPYGPSIDQVPLHPYIGAASVVDIGAARAISADVLEALEVPISPRMLFRSECSALPPSMWPTSFPAVTPDAATWLSANDVVLIGTDAPSVDPQDSETLPAHHALHDHKIAILEHLDLSDVEPGTYQLIAFPLRLAGMDASPVRAVLVNRS